MGNSIYFGNYLRFEAPSKKQGVQLTNADNLVGDIYEIQFIAEDDGYVAWMKNRFGASVGYFNKKDSRTMKLMNEQGWTVSALLAYVAFTDHPQPGIYWGEAAVIAYDPQYEAFQTYTKKLSARLAEGIRPVLTLGDQGVSKVLDSHGEWAPSKTLAALKSKPGTAFLKTRRGAMDKLIEQGRNKNKGCYLGTLLVFIGLLALILFALHSFGVF